MDDKLLWLIFVASILNNQNRSAQCSFPNLTKLLSRIIASGKGGGGITCPVFMARRHDECERNLDNAGNSTDNLLKQDAVLFNIDVKKISLHMDNF